PAEAPLGAHVAVLGVRLAARVAQAPHVRLGVRTRGPEEVDPAPGLEQERHALAVRRDRVGGALLRLQVGAREQPQSLVVALRHGPGGEAPALGLARPDQRVDARQLRLRRPARQLTRHRGPLASLMSSATRVTRREHNTSYVRDGPGETGPGCSGTTSEAFTQTALPSA